MLNNFHIFSETRHRAQGRGPVPFLRHVLGAYRGPGRVPVTRETKRNEPEPCPQGRGVVGDTKTQIDDTAEHQTHSVRMGRKRTAQSEGLIEVSL